MNFFSLFLPLPVSTCLGVETLSLLSTEDVPSADSDWPEAGAEMTARALWTGPKAASAHVVPRRLPPPLNVDICSFGWVLVFAMPHTPPPSSAGPSSLGQSCLCPARV